MAKKNKLNQHYFQFQSGFCHITPNEILCTTLPEPDPQHLVPKIKRPIRQIVVYAFFAFIFTLYFFEIYYIGYPLYALVFLFFAVLFTISTLNLLNQKLIPLIPKNRIIEVKYIKKIPLLAHAAITVTHLNEKNKKQTSWFYLNDEQVEQAQKVLKHYGLLK